MVSLCSLNYRTEEGDAFYASWHEGGPATPGNRESYFPNPDTVTQTK